MRGHLVSAGVLQYRATTPPQPSSKGLQDEGDAKALPCAAGAVLQWVAAGLESCQGILARTSETGTSGACIMHEGRTVFIRCLLAFRSVTHC